MGRLEQTEQPQAGQFKVRGLSAEPARVVAGAGLGKFLEQSLGELDKADFYILAEFVFNARVEELKQFGELQRLSEIVCEEQLDDHFDELARLYRQTCLELGLTWPPPAIDGPGFERKLDREGQEVAAAEVEHLRQPFVVVSVCREDLRGILSDDEIVALSNNDMARIADRMGDAYQDSGSYWDSLEVMVRVVTKRHQDREA